MEYHTPLDGQSSAQTWVRYFIKQSVSTNTAPSPTGLKLNMIKKWPVVIKTKIFTALCNLRSTRDVPAQWKLKLLPVKPKIESVIPTVNDWGG